jgi:hypothetical protein
MLRAQGFRDFLQEVRRQGVRVLVTSQWQLGCGLQRAEQLHLNSLSPEHAAELLRQEAGAARVTPSEVHDLALICGHNALALKMIGGMIASQAATAKVWGIFCSQLATPWQNDVTAACQEGTMVEPRQSGALAIAPHVQHSCLFGCSCRQCMAQEAIADAHHAGLRGVAADTFSASGDLINLSSGAAAELEARRVSGFWLSQYLSNEQREATACLSLFAATFDARGAAAVVPGSNGSAQQRADTVKMLRALRGVSVVQEAQQSSPGHLRYSMHPLVRGVTVELRSKQPQTVQDAAAFGFVSHMLWKGGTELAESGQTVANAPVGAGLPPWEAPHFRAVVQLIAAPERARARAMLEKESQPGTECRTSMDAFAIPLSRCGASYCLPQRLAMPHTRTGSGGLRNLAQRPAWPTSATCSLMWESTLRPRKWHGRRWRGNKECLDLSTLTR